MAAIIMQCLRDGSQRCEVKINVVYTLGHAYGVIAREILNVFVLGLM